jgi:asparagine synthase (glutamine-hydrolysing)
MCGIVALFSRAGPAPHRGLWPDLVNRLAHRGPDGGGFWAEGPFLLGHRRLSIIGLDRGAQPMASADESLVVTFNGEIYNHLELREQLAARGHRFTTDSDTEVLLCGWREWGTELPAHLAGMFAFALADRARGELYVARDRFGEKPLFVARGPSYVALASEVKALAALPDLDRSLDPHALGAYLCLNYVPGERTLLAAVGRIAPGTWTLFSSSGERSGRYWTLPVAAPAATRPMDEAIEDWRPRFDRAVRLALRSDVPVGVFLSGGIDSALVAESAVRQGSLSRAYFLDFDEPGYSERDAATAVAKRLSLPVERAVLSAAVLEDFLRIVEHADDPLADSSAVAVWALARHAAKTTKVVLGGDGGDELFGGYLTYRASALHARWVAPMPRALRAFAARLAPRMPTSEGKVTASYKLRRFLRAADLPTPAAHVTWNGAWLPREACDLLRPGPARDAVHASVGELTRGLDAAAPDLGALQRLDLANYLPNDILCKMDRMTMAHGLESRAPFLDHDLAAWAVAQPDELRIDGRGRLKALLRAAARKTFGDAIADRPKQGFSIPIHAWLRGPMRETVRDLLSPGSLERVGVLDAARVGRVVGDHMSGRRSYGFELWGLCVLSAWHRARVQNAPAPAPSFALRELRLTAR